MDHDHQRAVAFDGATQRHLARVDRPEFGHPRPSLAPRTMFRRAGPGKAHLASALTCAARVRASPERGRNVAGISDTAEDHKEGVASFLEKREPVFRGR